MPELTKTQCRHYGPGHYTCRRSQVAEGAHCLHLTLDGVPMIQRYVTEDAVVYSSPDYTLYLTAYSEDA